jgi:methionyl-tRNA formyltransferase
VRVVFFGSGPFGLPALDALHRSSRHQLACVATRPDRPAGRGRKLAPTPIRRRAAELGIPCEAPPTANDPRFLETLRSLAPDIFIVADYGEMLRKALREVPRLGAFNLHASALPAYRGAAPVVHALLAGETQTGITLFRIEKGLDTGPVVAVERTAIEPLETAGELEARLALLAAGLLERGLDELEAGTAREVPQDDSRATLAPRLDKSAGAIAWDAPPGKLADFVRALNPWPGAFSFLHAEGRKPERTIFLRARPAAGVDASGVLPGAIRDAGRQGFSVACRGGALEVLELQREGKGAVNAAAYVRGRPLAPGDRFGPLPS